MTIWRMRIGCRIPKSTHTLSEYAIPTAFPLQQRLHEGASMLQLHRLSCSVLALFKKNRTKINLWF